MTHEFFQMQVDCVENHKVRPMVSPRWELNDDGYVQPKMYNNSLSSDREGYFPVTEKVEVQFLMRSPHGRMV